MTINACVARMVAHTKYIYNIFLWIYQKKIFAVMHSQKCACSRCSLNFQVHLGLYKAYLLSVMCLYNRL